MHAFVPTVQRKDTGLSESAQDSDLSFSSFHCEDTLGRCRNALVLTALPLTVVLLPVRASLGPRRPRPRQLQVHPRCAQPATRREHASPAAAARPCASADACTRRPAGEIIIGVFGSNLSELSVRSSCRDPFCHFMWRSNDRLTIPRVCFWGRFHTVFLRMNMALMYSRTVHRSTVSAQLLVERVELHAVVDAHKNLTQVSDCATLSPR